MDRRRFLDPRHLASFAEPVAAPPESPEEIALLRLGCRAMATGYELLTPMDTPDALAAAREAFALLAALEDQLSVYRDNSEVCRLNFLAPQRPVPVEPRLYALLELAFRITHETDGAFDLTSGALIKAWGFFRGPRRVPAPAELAVALARTGIRHLAVHPTTRSVHYRVPGLEINLGGIGKGYALDRMAELLTRHWNFSAVLLHGGASSVYAKGSPHGDGRGWQVSIRHPWEPRQLASVWLRDRALGTSAATFQYLEHEGRKLGHVLDPRTGWPATGMQSVSVLAPTGTEADALSTAFYVGGVDLARRYCAMRPEIGAVLLADGTEDAETLNLTPQDCVLSGSRQ